MLARSKVTNDATINVAVAANRIMLKVLVMDLLDVITEIIKVGIFLE